ncbi:ImmA/IrrE family metallo-endopeptidase [Planococcus sp. ANT_H30]|uniref:ImmA/IrrE family metallo-endopeptidase n=1 Tax=Planococcus sp. ANT_H30 TaxID=2597347 RepID=UPI0011F060B3|nr:ImmA/IrrE family metallo-endopeptidase [Planococcus sp. ANT_H30]KAA0956675.1 ImmA/IrrE family metallo-endopeptidase [Planococcus sp. ANT_H30]
MSYTYNATEDYLNNFFQSIDIYSPQHLDLEEIAYRTGLSVLYMPTEAMNIKNTIILDERSTDAEQWQDFGHELCHALWHFGNQITMPMPYQVYQENKSNNFAQYACIPSFMLKQITLPDNENEAVWLIMETFGVTRPFAEKRLRQYIQNMIYG